MRTIPRDQIFITILYSVAAVKFLFVLINSPKRMIVAKLFISFLF